MPFCFLSNDVAVGDGCIINTRASVHHDSFVGDFCDIAPSTTLLGGTEIGESTFIGAGSIILPK